jgi:hypothetical protein
VLLILRITRLNTYNLLLQAAKQQSYRASLEDQIQRRQQDAKSQEERYRKEYESESPRVPYTTRF